MRVLHVIPDLSRAFGGPVAALLGFLAACRATGIDAAVAAPIPPADDVAWFKRQAGMAPVHFFRTHGRGSARFAPGLQRYLAMQRSSVDAVHVHGLFNAVSTLAARSCRRGGVPYVIGPFGTLSRYTFAHRRTILKRVYFALLDDAAIRSAGAMHFTTAHERDEARRLDAVRAVPSVVVPPAWVTDAGAPTASNHSGARDAGETVLFLGRLHPIKALEALIDAWPVVRRSRPSARLIVAGSGDSGYERSLKARVMQSGCGDSVQFTGFITGSEKARWLSEAALFVLPSYHENFGVSVLEAVAAGVAVVVSPDVQLAEVVREQKLGIVASREPEALSRGILCALGDLPLRQRVAAEGNAVVQSLFSPETVGLKLRAMYELARSRSTT